MGYGNGEEYWRNIISELRMAGYDYAVSIEHDRSQQWPSYDSYHYLLF